MINDDDDDKEERTTFLDSGLQEARVINAPCTVLCIGFPTIGMSLESCLGLCKVQIKV